MQDSVFGGKGVGAGALADGAVVKLRVGGGGAAWVDLWAA